jgi:hypothetical protein
MASNRDRIRDTVAHAMVTDLSDVLRDGPDAHVDLPTVVDSEIMVGRSMRLPAALDASVREIAARRGVKPSTLIRQWIEAGVADEQADTLVSLAEVLSVLNTLSRRPGAA